MEQKYQPSNIVFQCQMPCTFKLEPQSQSAFTIHQAQHTYHQHQLKIKNKQQDILDDPFVSKMKSLKTITTTNSNKRSLKKNNHQHSFNQELIHQSPINEISKYEPPVLKYNKSFKQTPRTPYLGSHFKKQSFSACDPKLTFIHNQFCHQIQQQQKNYSHQQSVLQCTSVYTNEKIDQAISLNSFQQNQECTIIDQLKKSNNNPNLKQRNCNDNVINEMKNNQIKNIDNNPIKIKNNNDQNGKIYSESCSRKHIRYDNQPIVQQFFLYSKRDCYRRILENTSIRKVQSVIDQNPQNQQSHVIPYSKIVINISAWDYHLQKNQKNQHFGFQTAIPNNQNLQ